MQDLKKNQLITIIILVIALGLFFWIFVSKSPSGQSGLGDETPGRALLPMPEGTKSLAKSPAKPEPPLDDFPWEAGAKFTDTGSVYSGSDYIKIVRIYSSKKTVSENYNLFKEYFVTKSWTVSAEQKSASASSFTAEFGSTGSKISMKFVPDNSTKGSIVEVREEKPVYVNLEIR